MKMHKVFVYGTLRTPDPKELVKVPGRLYDLGWFPGALVDETSKHSFVAEVRLVSDEQLEDFDHYEGYYPNAPKTSLYIRKPYGDGYIYQYNRDVSRAKLVESGDWKLHLKSRQEEAA